MARLNVVKSFRGTTKTEDGCLTCEHCREKICKGDGYRWWANRLPGQRSSYRRIRCMKSECTPTVVDMTPGRRGQLYQIQQQGERAVYEWDSNSDTDELEGIAETVAGEIREIAEGLRESAENIEDGFGHATYQSDELNERADTVEGYADEIEQCDFDDAPDPEDYKDATSTCTECAGAGVIEEELDDSIHETTCEECSGSGEVEDESANEDAYNEAVSEWQSEQRDKLIDLINEADIE